jgi:hypothetical protein
MAKGWKKRLRRGRLATWLGRIEGVEKPALLVGIGLLLYRVWRNDERRIDLKGRWRGAIARVRRRFGDRSTPENAIPKNGAKNGATTADVTTPSSPVLPS